MWWWSWCPEVAQCGGGHGALRWHNVVVVMVPGRVVAGMVPCSDTMW